MYSKCLYSVKMAQQLDLRGPCAKKERNTLMSTMLFAYV